MSAAASASWYGDSRRAASSSPRRSLRAKQAQESAREAVAKAALLEARLNEVSVQRSQLEELIQSVARSRDENLVADIEADLRAAVQQAALTGSAEPLVTALRQSEERLLRANQPRLEPVRRAIARDIDRAIATNVADVATLSIKLDDAVRMVDELPLLPRPSRVAMPRACRAPEARGQRRGALGVRDAGSRRADRRVVAARAGARCDADRRPHLVRGRGRSFASPASTTPRRCWWRPTRRSS